MPSRITITGQVTVPRRVLEALRLSPGDAVEFQLNGSGEFVMRKAPAIAPGGRRAARRLHPGVQAQMRRRAAELLALLRGLD